MNSYGYARNNPIIYKDPNGDWLDAVVDVGFAIYGGYKLGQAIVSGDGEAIESEAINFSLDAGGTIIPGVVGTGSLRRTALKADEVAQTATKIIKDFEVSIEKT